MSIFVYTLIQIVMKKIFLLCMAGALALAATACDDDDRGGESR